jgi:hypothetical protein
MCAAAKAAPSCRTTASEPAAAAGRSEELTGSGDSQADAWRFRLRRDGWRSRELDVATLRWLPEDHGRGSDRSGAGLAGAWQRMAAASCMAGRATLNSRNTTGAGGLALGTRVERRLRSNRVITTSLAKMAGGLLRRWNSGSGRRPCRCDVESIAQVRVRNQAQGFPRNGRECQHFVSYGLHHQGLEGFVEAATPSGAVGEDSARPVAVFRHSLGAGGEEGAAAVIHPGDAQPLALAQTCGRIVMRDGNH